MATLAHYKRSIISLKYEVPKWNQCWVIQLKTKKKLQALPYWSRENMKICSPPVCQDVDLEALLCDIYKCFIKENKESEEKENVFKKWKKNK